MKKPTVAVVARANQAYGEAKAHLHDAGYAYERGCQRLRALLANDDWRQSGNGFKNVDEFMQSLQLDQFAKVTEEKREIAKLIKALRPEVSNRAIARALKTDESTLRENPARKAKRANKTKARMRENPAPPPAIGGQQAAKTVERADRIKDRQTLVAGRVAKVSFDAAKLGKYSIILADPPWDDDFGANRRSTENHYPTMSIEDIWALRVCEIAHDQAMLFLWATSPMLEPALATVKAWGFEYRTNIIWKKPSIGLGQYVRQQHELLLVCRRGDHPAPDATLLPPSVIEAPRGEHSEKPAIFHEIIERMYHGGVRIELFRRGEPRAGWTAWGAEAKQTAQAAE
jgi:N6-adenosine-specific RNA methylase IME4